MGGSVGKETFSSLLSEHLVGLSSYHCAMIGLDSAGKTTVLYRLKFNQYVNSTPTIGFNCEKVKLNGSGFTVWDVGGQEKLRPLWRSYTRCTDAIIYVVDSCKEDRLEEAKLELLKICKTCGQVPVLVLANKQDLPDALDASKIESLLGLKELGPNQGRWHVQPTCAITGEGLDEGIVKLKDLIVQRRRMSRSGKGKLGQLAQASASTGSSSKATRKVQRSHSHL